MTEKKKISVVLFQLGGPDSSSAVEPFLYNLFCDPDIIDFFGAWFARRPLAHPDADRAAGPRSRSGARSALRRAMLHRDAVLESADSGSRSRSENLGRRGARSTSLVSAVFVCHFVQQLEGMEAALQPERKCAARARDREVFRSPAVHRIHR